MPWKKYKGITRFEPTEFPENPEEHADIFYIRQLNEFAIALKSAVFPSPVSGALARFYGSSKSRHYAVGRQSDACDVFCNCPISKAFFTALQFFTGVGVYFDTRYMGGEWPMLHTDLRDRELMWYREDGVYFYPHTSKTFYNDLATKLANPVTTMASPLI